MILEEDHEWVNEWVTELITYNNVWRKTPATPGLLFIAYKVDLLIQTIPSHQEENIPKYFNDIRFPRDNVMLPVNYISHALIVSPSIEHPSNEDLE